MIGGIKYVAALLIFKNNGYLGCSIGYSYMTRELIKDLTDCKFL